MKRRAFIKRAAIASFTLAASPYSSFAKAEAPSAAPMDSSLRKDWLDRWEKRILADAKNRYCDKAKGEELGWLASPFLNGFYYGYLATRQTQWIDLLDDWMESCLRRASKEPDGYSGWPKGDGGGGESPEYYADSLLGEAMLLRPVVLMAREILNTPDLEGRYGGPARAYLKFAEEMFQKWDARGAWRETPEGGLWVVPEFGLDWITGAWSSGYARRQTGGFSNPANKQNHIARWLVALHDATQKPVYRERAAKWFALMKTRLRSREDGKYYVWNYWDPAGPWDRKADGSLKHWVGVHPNGGYYAIDIEGMATAFKHELFFNQEDMNRLVATNRDFMWNHQIEGARFQRIDGGAPDPRWKNTPGVLWEALIPFDATLEKIFLANHDPASWGGISATPWYLSQQDQSPRQKPR